jgi:hypothetical protein
MPDPIKPIKKGKKATTKKAKKQKAKEASSERTKEMGGPNMSYSPTKMESAKQEKYNLMHDNPVAKDASGGRDASWMSKHSKSALHMGHESPAQNLGHGMDDMSPEKGAHRDYHLKQRMSKKSKD